MNDAGSDDEPGGAVVIDFLPRGRADDDRPQYERSPVALALDRDSFGLFEIALEDGEAINIGDELVVEPADERPEWVTSTRRIEYDDLTGAGQSELPYAIESIVDADERRFVDFYNDAQPITLRLHQLNLLPGIGKKLRNGILDERKRGPFESFEDVAERVSGLHDPRQVIVDRIAEEIQDDDLKYQIFVDEV